jgi:catechol 2,3-dioxygenase-like lactoylglutathione lyase family enzyme
MTTPTVLEVRIALTSRDYEKSLRFYSEGLGIEPAELWENGASNGAIFSFPSGSLEVFDEPQAGLIDDIEAGQRVSGQIRLAFKVLDVYAAMERLLANGAVLVRPPVITPWGDINVRLVDPDGMQCTLFQTTESKTPA